MARSTVLPFVLLALGALITLYNVAGGLRFSFPLLLGLLLLADGVLRLLSGREGEPDADAGRAADR